MLTKIIATFGGRQACVKFFRRNIGVTGVCLQNVAADPIQKLFIDKIHEYATKSKSAGGKLVDATPELEKSLNDDLDKITRVFGADKADFTKFPTFNFTEENLESVGLNIDPKQMQAKEDAIHEDIEEEEIILH